MSRICIKNLPKYVAEDRLREMFSQKGEVTDAKLMRTKDGKSRQFAFIGYRTEHEAEEAIKYFNRSYLDTCRITCEIAYKVGDPHAPRPWSRYSLTKEGKLSEDEKKVTDAKYEGLADLVEDAKKLKKSSRDNDDPQLQEFLQVMQPRIRSKLWADDTLGASVISLTGNTSDNLAQENNRASENLDTGEAELKEMKKSECKISDNHLRGKSQHLAHDEGLSDMDYFKSRVKEQWADSDSTEDHSDSDNDKECHKQDIQEHDSLREYGLQEEDEEAPLSSSKDAKEEVLKTGRVFVRNLPYTATEDELEQLFRKFGDVSNVHLVVDKVTKRSKGIAYVLFTLPECALRALEHLDNSSFQGRLLHVMPAKQSNSPDKQKPDVSRNQSSKTFKKQREEERKAAEVIGDTKAWNSLFMRSDTVAENIARKYGVSKSNLLDRDVDDLAVHLALGETQVLLETKMALANAGVNVASLEEHSSGKSDGIKRSNQVLLVKNLPFGSSEAELARMFGKYGSLDKIIIPATKILALVVFLEPVEARAAFRGLAYKRYKDAPLYLEWAPGNIFDKDPTFTSNGDIKTVVGEHCAKGALLKHDSGEIHDMENDPDRVESRTLFIKNLNFKTTDENLKGHFGEHTKNGRILSAKVKKHLKDGKSVSMGFGFIEFDSVETATNVCRDLQGTVLDGHALILQLCHTKEDENVLGKVDKDKSSTKLIVRNVAFEATKKDLRQLFTPFGQMKSLRLPMKFGNHRGFAFVEFITKQEAQNALKSLSNTHLYGRHLVLERAKEGETLEELRARTAVQFAGEQNGGSGGHLLRLSKKRKQIALLDEGNAKFGRIAS